MHSTWWKTHYYNITCTLFFFSGLATCTITPREVSVHAQLKVVTVSPLSERRLKAVILGTAYFVSGVMATLMCFLSAALRGDLPEGPRKKKAYKDPFLAVDSGRVTFTSLKETINIHEGIFISKC